MDIVRMGIVGSGHMGRTYARCLTDHNRDVRLVAVTGGSRAPKLASDFEVDHVHEYAALIARDDIDAVLGSVLRHRVLLNFTAQSEGTTVDSILEAIRSSVDTDPVSDAIHDGAVH